MLNQQLSETALRVLIAPDSFKGSLPAGEVADAISRGWRLVRSNDDVRCRPLADGGEGTLDAIAAAVPGARFIRVSDVAGPNGRRKEARYLQPPERVALLELAQTSGLPDPSQRDPLSASTRGLGELLDVALDRGAQRVIVALGGSATTDGALGASRGHSG